MKPLRLLLTSICFFLSALTHARAQYYYYNSRFYETPLSWELGASAGGMNCLTDLGGKKEKARGFLSDLNWVCTRPALSVFGRAVYGNKIGCRLETGFGTVTAYDSLNQNKSKAKGRYQRNLQFETTILEALLLAELYPLSWLAAARHPVYLFQPYLIAGVGFFHFNPVAKTGAVPVRLHPLRTEGQGFPEYPDRKPYSLNQLNLPLGLGLKYEVSALFVCSIEMIYRKLFTDYLDDVSKTYIDPSVFNNHFNVKQASLAASLSNRSRQNSPHQDIGTTRGNPGNNDAYLSFNMKMAVMLGREKR
jgi:hypothetical protein